ncbi:hypothetical protein K2173_005672 [Erythroxylum novogranatense]|uniref:BZIP domain-containing protein n=1 Tax=Erythroxylum novogranatense TaxID=1862640 RepID=A0AAV8SQF3_9ROSI|nr:hypothetical protein K2173_005672 [Erythroxylum novogranatense]
MKGSRSSTMNSGSDILEVLSFISTELGLSSSTSRSYGVADEDAQKDQDAHNLQEKMDVSIEQLSGANHLEYLPVCVGGDIPSSESIESDTFNASGEVNKENFQVPKLGMTFLTEEEVYEFYKDYATKIGFKVRKAKVQKLSDGTISKRYFFCSKQGLKQPSKKLRKYTRKVTRTGCPAKIQCTVKNGKWVISQVCVQHNHHLECQKQVKRPYSKTSEVQLTIHSENETKTIASTSGSDWEEQLMRKRKRKRVLSNRELARPSRMRKQKHLDDLGAQIGLLREEINGLVCAGNTTTQHFLNVEAENAILRARISELSQRLDSLKEIIACLNGMRSSVPFCPVLCPNDILVI